MRCVVEPVHVLDDESVGIIRSRSSSVASASCRRSRAPAGSSASTSGVESSVRVEREREQRQPGGEVGCDGADEERELLSGLLARSVGRDARPAARRSGRTAANGSAFAYGSPATSSCWNPIASVRASATSRDLPMPGSRDDLEQLQLAQPCSSDRVAKHVELRLAPDDRARVDRRPRTAAGRLADGVGQDRGLLALDEQRLDLRRVRRARAVEDVRRREDRPGRRPGGQPRGEVDGVAHHGVGPSRRRADVAGEDAAAVDAGPEREPDVGGHDVAQRAEHRLLVLTGRRGSAGGEVELRGVGVDVRLEPRQPVAPAGVGDDAGQRVEPTARSRPDRRRRRRCRTP